MNGRSLAAFICALFVIGIVWMIAGIPKGVTSKSSAKLFEPITPVSPAPGKTSGQESTAQGQKEGEQKPEESVPVPKKAQPKSEESQKESAKTEAGEPPDVVTYPSDFGKVTFSHTKHKEAKCTACHHEFKDGQSHDNGLLVVYLVSVAGGELRAGDDAQAVGWFPAGALPEQIAFSSHRAALAIWLENAGHPRPAK